MKRTGGTEREYIGMYMYMYIYIGDNCERAREIDATGKTRKSRRNRLCRRTSGKCIGIAGRARLFFLLSNLGRVRGLNRKSVFSRNYNVERIRASIFFQRKCFERAT